MALQLNRTYRFKFYLNANHYIIINGVEGETHPHTWEFTIDIMIKNDEFVEFNTYEKSISEYFAKYQNGIMNNFEPFDTVIPTLENMSEKFILDIRDIVEAGDAKLRAAKRRPEVTSSVSRKTRISRKRSETDARKAWMRKLMQSLTGSRRKRKTDHEKKR